MNYLISTIIACVSIAAPPALPPTPESAPQHVDQPNTSSPVRALAGIEWASLSDEVTTHAGIQFAHLAYKIDGEERARGVLVACHEVSVADMKEFLDATSYHRTETGKGVMSLDFRPPKQADHPAGYLSQVDALHYIEWHNKQHPATTAVRLPTIIERVALSKAVVDADGFREENRNRVLELNLDGYVPVSEDDTHAVVKHVFSNVDELTCSRPAAELLDSIEFEPVDEQTLRQLVIVYAYRDGKPTSLWFTWEDFRPSKSGIRLVADVAPDRPGESIE